MRAWPSERNAPLQQAGATPHPPPHTHARLWREPPGFARMRSLRQAPNLMLNVALLRGRATCLLLLLLLLPLMQRRQVKMSVVAVGHT